METCSNAGTGGTPKFESLPKPCDVHDVRYARFEFIGPGIDANHRSKRTKFSAIIKSTGMWFGVRKLTASVAPLVPELGNVIACSVTKPIIVACSMPKSTAVSLGRNVLYNS